MRDCSLNKLQIFTLVGLRLLIGWHLLYEGLVKVLNPSWSATAFLENAQGPLAGFFIQLTENNKLLFVIDILNEWGLICIGLSLIIGFYTSLGLLGGIVLLSLYYISNPPFIGIDQASGAEGNYLIVNKNLIEIGAMLVLLFFRTSHIYGLDRFFNKSK